MSGDLKIENVSVTYGSVKAVNDVSLEIPFGELHGVIGPNGAGKSTFMDALSGRAKGATGRVWFGDEELTGRSPAWLRRHGLSRSFQRTSVFPDLTVGRQLELVANHLGEEDMDGLVRTFGLAQLLDRVCGTISYGDQRRVDLLLALFGQPKILLLDEPAAGLTRAETDTLVDHLLEAAENRPLTVLLVEHDVDAVFRFANRVTVLDQGRVLASGDPETLRADPRVITAYLGSAA